MQDLDLLAIQEDPDEEPAMEQGSSAADAQPLQAASSTPQPSSDPAPGDCAHLLTWCPAEDVHGGEQASDMHTNEQARFSVIPHFCCFAGAEETVSSPAPSSRRPLRRLCKSLTAAATRVAPCLGSVDTSLLGAARKCCSPAGPQAPAASLCSDTKDVEVSWHFRTLPPAAC